MFKRLNQKIKSYIIVITAKILTVFYYIGMSSYKVIKSFLKLLFKGLILVGKFVNKIVRYIYYKFVLTLYSGFKSYFTSFRVFKNKKGIQALKEQWNLLKQAHDRNIVGFHRFVRVLVGTVVVVTIVATSGVWSQLTACYKVVYNGVTLGFIENQSIYDEALNCVDDYVGSADAKSVLNKPSFSFAIKNKADLMEKNTLAVGMIKKTPGFSYAYGLFINGNRYLICENYNSIDYNLGIVLNKYEYKGENLTLSFQENVEIIPSYYSNDIIFTANETYSYFENNDLPLTVIATVERTAEETVKYKTVKLESSKKIIGYSVVLCDGQNGKANVTKRYIYKDGKVIDKTEIAREIIKEPIDKRVVYGTASIDSGTLVSKLAGNVKYLWPVAGTRGTNISAYYGDGRNHKGLDIAMPLGTNIYSVSDGVVISAGTATGTESSYGNWVLIKHSDGTTSTAYAHASSVYVSVGDVVRKGQVIAAVGSTGNSTGNHLHFEVRKNGVRVDPAPYLGLY